MISATLRPDCCLITGATGFIGSRLCQRLDSNARQPYVAMVRSAQTAAAFRSRGVRAATGDLMNSRQVHAALDSCDAVIHLAQGDKGPEATRQLVSQAARRGVKRFVHISTMAVHGPVPGPDAAHEDTARIGRYNHDYSDSKAEQEEIVQAAHQRGDICAVILRPTVVYGPGGHFVLQVLQQAAAGTVTMFDQGQGVCNAVYVDDVCDAIEAALVSGDATGQAMFVNDNRSITWGEFISTFAAMFQPAPRTVQLSSADALSYWAANPPAPPAGLLQRLYRKAHRLVSRPPAPPPWPVLGRVQRETLAVTFSNQKARRLLNWAPKVDFQQGAEFTRQWLKAEGYLG